MTSTREDPHREKAKAAISSVLWSLLLTGLKIWAGVATNSLGVLSEALHSGLDFCAAAMTFYAVRMAARPADEDHQYGHEKVENLSALAETGLLLVTCLWIVWEAGNRLIFGEAELELTWWAFAVVGISLAVDINRAAMLKRVARAHKSQALEADAMHFTTDIYSSAVVLLGLICAWASQYAAPGGVLRACLEKADAVAGLFVAVLVCSVAWGLGKRAIHALMDGGDLETNAKIRKVLEEKAREYPLLKLRARDIGAKTYVELTIGTPPELFLNEAHEVTERVEDLVRSAVPDADVFVHVEPASVPVGTTPDMVAQALALRYHVRVHGFCELEREEGRAFFMDVELPGDVAMGEGHAQTQAFQQALSQNFGGAEIIVRIEPDKRGGLSGKDGEIPRVSEDEVFRIAEITGAQIPEIKAITGVEVNRTGGRLLVVVRGEASGALSVDRCHEFSSAFEKRVQSALSCPAKVALILDPQEA